MFYDSFLAKWAMTPKSGVNLCQIDAFDFPPDNIVLIEHYATMDEAKQAVAKMPKLSLDMYVLIGSDGTGIMVDDGKGGPAPEEPAGRAPT